MPVYDEDWELLRRLGEAFEDYWQREAPNCKGTLVYAGVKQRELPIPYKIKRRRVAKQMLEEMPQPDCLVELSACLTGDPRLSSVVIRDVTVEILRTANSICQAKNHQGSWMRFIFLSSLSRTR